MTSFFSRALVTLVVMGLLNSCASRPSTSTVSWNPSSWFGKSTVTQKAPAVQTPPPAPTIPPVAPMAAAIPAPVAQPSASKVQVAILLPLSGKNADLGQAMLNAAQQAVFDVGDTHFELMPRDTGSSDTGAETAARDAVASGAQLLIGPLFATNIPAVHAVVQSTGLNMLTLSTDTSQAAPGVYVMGFAPAPQVDRVVDFAASHGLKRFAALVPNSAYGELVGREFQNAVARAGGSVIAMETYDPARRDSDQHVKALAAKRDQIDALFLPEGGSELSVISGQISMAGFDNQRVRLLGTGLWDVADLAHQAPFLAGGWYAASDPAARHNFITTYAATYGQEPPRLASLAYDATALAAVLAKRNAGFDQSALTNPNGFAGLDGIFRLTSQGLTERGLAVNEIGMDGPRVISPAPTTFVGY